MANLITLARILLILPFAALFFINTPWAMTAALAFFLIASLSDFLDGYVARKRGETSALGAALDPLADKLLVAATLLLLTHHGLIAGLNLVGALIILLREIWVGGLREALAQQGPQFSTKPEQISENGPDTSPATPVSSPAALPVSFLGKLKTTLQLTALSLWLASAPTGLFGPALAPVAIGVFWAAVIASFWSGAQYTKTAISLLGASRKNQ